MKTLTKIACRTIGTVGLGLALYDASRVASRISRNTSELTQANYLEKSYFNSRTIDNDSYVSNSLREKAFDLNSKNPIPSLWGRVKGYVNGGVNSLGNNLVLVSCSSLALLGKGWGAKLGSVGVALTLAYDFLRNGFGLGKNNPIKKV